MLRYQLITVLQAAMWENVYMIKSKLKTWQKRQDWMRLFLHDFYLRWYRSGFYRPTDASMQDEALTPLTLILPISQLRGSHTVIDVTN